MLRSSLFNHSDVYTLVKETLTVANTAAADSNANTNKKVIFKIVRHLLAP